MRFLFRVECEVNIAGLFATREELFDQIREAIERADPGSLEGDEGGQYETAGWDVDELHET